MGNPPEQQFRNTGSLTRDGFMLAEFESDAEKYPKQIGLLWIDGTWHNVEQARELRDFLNQVLSAEVCETCKGRKFYTVHLSDGSDADDQPCPDCNPNGDSRDAP